MSTPTRYSEEDLEMFKKVIEQKLEKATADFSFLYDQIQNISESMSDDSDLMDETFNNSELEMLHTMSTRQHHYMQDLKNALIRIDHKSYGVCVGTGKLIDKLRLLAVPTTTKSLEAKTAAATPKKRSSIRTQRNTMTKIINKVITKK
ncbi:MAG: DnaK suppressor protein [Saprospiraceae bacterium]|jgi:DnaK suppressor protein